jgi:hypothetical protein
MVLVEQIKNGGFLLGRFNVETKALTDIKVVNSRAHVPPNTDLTSYKLIGMGGDIPGEPLDEFADNHCQGWDGVTPINLYFSRAGGNFVRWEPTRAAAGAA